MHGKKGLDCYSTQECVSKKVNAVQNFKTLDEEITSSRFANKHDMLTAITCNLEQ